jgi:DNA-binding transcriptional ArsR family regulator
MPPNKRVSITVAVTPRFDLFYALYALVDDATTPVDQWKTRAAERLPARFAEIAQQVAPRPIFWPLLADTLQKIQGELTFDEIVGTLRQMSATELKANVLSGIFHDKRTVDSLISGKQSIRQVVERNQASASLLTHFGLRPYDSASESARAMSTLLTHTAAFREDLVSTLEKFWQGAFRADWATLAPNLLAAATRMRELEAQLALEDLAQELRLPVEFDKAAREVRPKNGPAIPYANIERCYVLPSSFNTRRWWAKYETRGDRVNLYFPVFRDGSVGTASNREPRRAAGREPPGSKIRAEQVFRALGDTTRYAIASVLARAPTTSAELARRLGVSKPTITHHIQTLRSAGLINEDPAGGPTKLSLNRETVAVLSRVALDQLFSASGDLPLDTTRKRRER